MIAIKKYITAFHKTFASAVAVRRPNIWVFLRVLKDQQALSENRSTFEAVRRGELPPRRRKKWRNLEERLKELKRQYNTGARNLDQFWSALIYLVPHPKGIKRDSSTAGRRHNGLAAQWVGGTAGQRHNGLAAQRVGGITGTSQ
ncbi:hypothetical protein ACOMHN_055026 [Nucella lapillus]